MPDKSYSKSLVLVNECHKMQGEKELLPRRPRENYDFRFRKINAMLNYWLSHFKTTAKQPAILSMTIFLTVFARQRFFSL